MAAAEVVAGVHRMHSPDHPDHHPRRGVFRGRVLHGPVFRTLHSVGPREFDIRQEDPALRPAGECPPRLPIAAGGGHLPAARFTAISRGRRDGATRNLSARDLRSRRTNARNEARANRRNAAAASAAARTQRMSGPARAAGSVGATFAARQAAHAGWYRNWRRHPIGFGWYGPLFWPYAYDSIFNDVFWPYAYDYDPFWDYGYGDIYTALFYPYSYDELLDVPPLPGGSRRAAIPERSTSPESGTSPGTRTMQKLATLCGDDAREVAGVPVDDIQTAVEPNDAQRAALDELGNAAIKAAQVVKDACPSDLRTDADGPDRLHAAPDRGNERGGSGRARSARKILRHAERRAEGTFRCHRPARRAGCQITITDRKMQRGGSDRMARSADRARRASHSGSSRPPRHAQASGR